MKTKILWASVLFLLALFQVVSAQTHLIETNGMLVFLFDIWAATISALLPAILLSILAALFPFKGKSFGQKLKFTVPLFTLIVLLILIISSIIVKEADLRPL